MCVTQISVWEQVKQTTWMNPSASTLPSEWGRITPRQARRTGELFLYSFIVIFHLTFTGSYTKTCDNSIFNTWYCFQCVLLIFDNSNLSVLSVCLTERWENYTKGELSVAAPSSLCSSKTGCESDTWKYFVGHLVLIWNGTPPRLYWDVSVVWQPLFAGLMQ